MSYDSSSDSKSLFDVFKKDNIMNSTSQISNYYQNVSNNSGLYIGLFIAIIFTTIVAILLYSYIGSQLFSKKKQIVSSTKIPILGTKSSKFTAEFAKTANGSRRSFSFWIYINDMAKYKGLYKNVLALSNNGNDFNPNTSSPHIFLDKDNNSLYIRFNTKSNNKSELCPTLNNIEDIQTYMKSGIYIKYIPLQRWVNIAIVCNTDSFNTSLYTYIDGDLVSTVSNETKYKINSIDITANLLDIDLNLSGYLYVGSDNISKCGPGFSGLLTNFTSYNYELNQQDIFDIYNKGPIDGLLARLGLSAYGIRSPIYKL